MLLFLFRFFFIACFENFDKRNFLIIAKMDIKSVQKAMEQLKAAKAEIEKLQKQKELAMENVKRARSAADTAQS